MSKAVLRAVSVVGCIVPSHVVPLALELGDLRAVSGVEILAK